MYETTNPRLVDMVDPRRQRLLVRLQESLDQIAEISMKRWGEYWGDRVVLIDAVDAYLEANREDDTPPQEEAAGGQKIGPGGGAYIFAEIRNPLLVSGASDFAGPLSRRETT